jgi:competence protein ComEC
MRAIWCGFALGVIALQQQVALPGWVAWVGSFWQLGLRPGGRFGR